MAKQIFVNLPVSDLGRSEPFYEALGFSKNPTFSDENASCMVWSDEIYVMLLAYDFYLKFTDGKQVADTRTTSAVLLALSLDSKEAVQEFADTANANGGRAYLSGAEEANNDVMFSYEVEDPDGHIWEPMWMDINAMNQQ